MDLELSPSSYLSKVTQHSELSPLFLSLLLTINPSRRPPSLQPLPLGFLVLDGGSHILLLRESIRLEGGTDPRKMNLPAGRELCCALGNGTFEK